MPPPPKVAKTHTSHLSTCPGPERCLSCRLFLENPGGFCPGCSEEYRARCLKSECWLHCKFCSGGRHAATTGCCGRAPRIRRRRWSDLALAKMPPYQPRRLEIRCHLIPVIHSVAKYRIPEKFPQIDAWAVPVHKVLRKDGSLPERDLKSDYGLLPHQKLILSTSAPDDYQELLWKGFPDLDLSRIGVDLCFPGHFSIYDNDSMMMQFANARRQQLHALWIRSPFVWFRLGEHIPLEFMEPVRRAPAVLIATGQMYRRRNVQILRQEVRTAQAWFPPESDFFFVGGLGHLKGIDFGERRLYQFNSSWLLRGLRGHDMRRNRVKKKTMERGMLLAENLKEVLRDVHPEMAV